MELLSHKPVYKCWKGFWKKIWAAEIGLIRIEAKGIKPIQSTSRKYLISRHKSCTLEARYREPPLRRISDSRPAFKAETWMNFFTPLSLAILASLLAPSTWTSSKEKFLKYNSSWMSLAHVQITSDFTDIDTCMSLAGLKNPELCQFWTGVFCLRPVCVQ